MANDRHSYVEFYPSDWMAGTAYMPVPAEWLYLQICLYNWDKREPVPKAQAALRFSRSPTWEADLAMLIDAGKVIRTDGEGLFVERALVAANKAYDLWERKSRGGKARKATGNAGQSGGGDKSLGKSPPKTAGSNHNQNQNQNQTPPDGGDPPAPQGAGDDVPAGDLIFSVPADAMKALRDHRTKLKHPMTKRAEELIVGKLEKIWAQHGHDPSAVIDQSILEGWRGVFPLKDESNDQRRGQGRSGAPDRRDGFTRAIHGDVFRGGKPPGDRQP